jgi:hypothetical protein
MDSNIIEFPTRVVRDWIGYEKVIREKMQEGGASPEMIKEVCERMKEVFPKFATGFEFRFEIPRLPEELAIAIQNSIKKTLTKFREEIHEYTNQLILEHLRLEIELYNLRHVGTQES